MKHTTALLCAVAIPALVAFAPKADSIKFAPEAGSSVTKTFSTTSNFSLDDMSVLVDGQAPPMMPELAMQMVMSQNTTVTDTYNAVAEGRPSKITRHYDSASTDIEMDMEINMMGETQNETGSGAGSSKLEGSTVVFTWNEESGAYVASFPEGEEGDAELLENLAEDMDLRGLLPKSGSLSEGETYEIPLTAMIDIFAPGGDLKLDIEMDGAETPMGPDPSMMGDFRRIFEEMVEGEATGKYLGTREVDGVKIGVIELTFKINAARDMSDIVSEIMGENAPEGMDMSIERMDVEFKYEGGGELHWNLAAGRAQGLALKGDAEMTMDMEMSMNMGQAMTIAMEMAMSGTLENKMSVE
jgi:hypothetical protein